MPISCIVLDDDPTYCDLVATLVSGHKDLRMAGKYMDTDEARQHLHHENIDILFVDMEMPKMTGLDFVKSLQEAPLIIFITSHRSYALDAYDVDATDYLLKPVSEYRFEKAVQKAVSRIETKKKAEISTSILDKLVSDDEYFVIRSDSQLVKVKFADVLYVEAMADFVKIHTQGQVLVALANLKNFENTMPKNVFMRIHRSYIVNINHVGIVSGNMIKMGEADLPIGESFKEALIEKFVGARLLKR